MINPWAHDIHLMVEEVGRSIKMGELDEEFGKKNLCIKIS